MPEAIAHKIVLAARPKGKAVASDFRLERAAAPVPGAGQLLLKTKYLSIDPYMRGRLDDRKSYAPSTPIGDVIGGESVAEVLVANLPGYSPGDLVLARTGWQTHSLSDSEGLRKLDPVAAPVTTGLGVLGMPGFTAYSGLRVIGQPKPGETVVVAAASGPVGSLVGQLARKAGARTVGIAEGQGPHSENGHFPILLASSFVLGRLKSICDLTIPAAIELAGSPPPGTTGFEV